jgi:hypothetical protein
MKIVEFFLIVVVNHFLMFLNSFNDFGGKFNYGDDILLIFTNILEIIINTCSFLTDGRYDLIVKQGVIVHCFISPRVYFGVEYKKIDK